MTHARETTKNPIEMLTTKHNFPKPHQIRHLAKGLGSNGLAMPDGSFEWPIPNLIEINFLLVVVAVYQLRAH